MILQGHKIHNFFLKLNVETHVAFHSSFSAFVTSLIKLPEAVSKSAYLVVVINKLLVVC